MPKHVPQIRISAADHVRREYESHSECGMSDVATDCEVLEASYSKKPKASKAKQESLDDGVLSTDIDGSSDEETETVVRYPVDCINAILDLGMSCEEVSNSQGPLKRQKSITCSLERAKPRTLNHDRFDDGGATDVEGMYMSEDEAEYKNDYEVDLSQFEPQAYVSVSDKVITGTIVSPRVTPEPGAEKKKRTSTLRTPVPISSVLTDTEMIISDTESNTTRSKKMTKVKSFKTFFGGFASDTEDSDASDYIPKSSRQNKKISCSRSFDTFNKVSVIKNNMLAPIRKKGSDCEQSLTDTEHIYLDDKVQKNESKSVSRPSVIKVNQSVVNQSGSTLRYRQNVAKSKPNQVPYNQASTTCCYQEKPQKQDGYALNVPMEDDPGNATDIEAFGSDSDDQVDDIKPVAYLPNPKCEMIIDNESHKGKMSIILPITDSQKNKTLHVEDLDCGYSDVEDLPGYEPEEYFRYPTPEVPRHTYMTEHSLVENKESVKDQSKLGVENSKPEPLTDTEDLDLQVKSEPVKSQLKVRVSQRCRKLSECHTDVEDLEDEHPKPSLVVDDHDNVVLTDVGDLSSDSDEDSYRFTAVTPDIELNNTYTSAMEAMSPFSFEVKKRMNDNIPKIRTISPSPIPRNHTDTEDFVGSQESAGSKWDYSDDGHIEPYNSVVLIKHTKKFDEKTERDHIKDFFSRPDPLTDAEELTMLEALEELNRKKRKHQKMKEQSEGTVRTCYSWQKGAKINSRGHKSSSKHDNSKGGGKSKEAVDSSWLSQHEGHDESIPGGFSQEGDLRSPYNKIGGIYYKEMADQSVYPPHFGYSEFEGDVLGSNSSLARGTDTFSELLFSSSNSESEEPDDNFLISKEQETCGILYDMSSHINKVPELLAKKAKAQVDVFLDSPEESLESRLKYYHELCNRSLSPEIHGVSPAERAELQELEESISQMLIDIRREESLFYNESQEEATNTIKRRPKNSEIEDERYSKINNDGESALKEIESHISKLLQDVEKEEREVMGSLRRDFRRSMEHQREGASENIKKSSEMFKEEEETWRDFKQSLEKLENTWVMINATCDQEDEQVQYVPFRESYTPSPVESSSTSEDEYEMVPNVQLNIGSRLGRSTIDISVQNSPRRKTRMTATRRSLNRSLPSLKSSSMSVIWNDHNSTECLLEPHWQPPVWQTSSVEYIAPPDHIDPDSGYCIWSYPDEEPYGKEPSAKDGKGPSDDEDMIPKRESETDKSSAFKKEPGKQTSPEKSIEQTKNTIEKQKSPSIEKEIQRQKSLSPEKEIQIKKSSSSEKELVKKKSPMPEKKVSTTGKTTFGFQKSSEDKSSQESKNAAPDKLVKTSTNKGEEDFFRKQQEGEGKITKKGPSPEKKIGLFGKTLETIKKPFQDRSEDKGERGKGKGKGKGKDKTPELSKSQESSLDEPRKSQEIETKQKSTGKIQQESLGKDPSLDLSISPADQITVISVEEKRDIKSHPDNTAHISEKADSNEKPTEALGTIAEKDIVAEPLLEKTIHPSRVPAKAAKVEESRSTVSVQKEKTKGKGKGKEKPEPQEVKVGIKDATEGTDKPVQVSKTNGKQEIQDEKPKIQASGATEEQDVKEASPELKSKGKGKGKDKQSPPAEGKSQKSGSTLVGKAVGVIKKPFQDQSKKSTEPKSDKKEGKGKKQRSIESTTSSLGEKDGESAESSTIPMKQSSEEKTNVLEDSRTVEPQEATPKGKKKDEGKGRTKQSSPEKPGFQKPTQKEKSKSPEKSIPLILEKPKATSSEKTPMGAQKSTKDQGKPEATKVVKAENISPTKEEKKKGKGKNKQKSPPESPIKEKGGEIKATKQGKKQVLEKQSTIEKAVEIVTRTFIDQPSNHEPQEQLESQESKTSKTEKLIKELSEEESGQEIEGKSIDLVTKPFEFSITQGEKRDTKTDKLMKELSIEKSGEIIEKGAIDLVAKPLQDMKSAGSQKIKDTQKTQKDGFEHIQKTIDDAKFKLDQFKGIVSDSSKQHRKDPKDTEDFIQKHEDRESSQEISILDSQEVEKENELMTIQKSIEQSFKLKTSETVEVYAKETPKVSIEYGTTENAAAETVDSVVREAEKRTAPTKGHETKPTASNDKKSDGRIVDTQDNLITSSEPSKKDIAALPHPKDIVVQVKEPIQSSLGKSVMGKNGGKKGKGNNNKDIPKQNVQHTAGTSNTTKDSNSTNDSAVIRGKTTDTDSTKTQEIEQKTTPKEARAGGLGEALKGFGKDAMVKLGGKKSKGKQKVETSKHTLETTAVDITSNVGPIGESMDNTLVSGSTTSVIDKAAKSTKDGSEQSSSLQDERVSIIDRSVETSKPEETAVQKSTPIVTETIGNVGQVEQSFCQGLSKEGEGFKEMSENKFETVKSSVGDNASVAVGLIETDSGETEKQASSVGTSITQLMDEGQKVIKMNQKLTNDGKAKIQEKPTVIEGIPGEREDLTEKTTTVTGGIEMDASHIVAETSASAVDSLPAIGGRITEAAPVQTQELEQKSTPKETKAIGLGGAIKGFGKDAMEKLSGRKSKGKQKAEESKQILETAAVDITSGAASVAGSLQDKTTSTKQKVTKPTTSVIDIAEKNMMSEQITSLEDEGASTIERSVDTRSKPGEIVVQKMTTMTREIIGKVEQGADQFGQTLVEKAERFNEESRGKLEDVKQSVSDTKVIGSDLKPDTQSIEGPAGSARTSMAKLLDHEQMVITETIQQITDGGKAKIQETTTIIGGIPRASESLIEKTTAFTREIADDASQTLNKESTSTYDVVSSVGREVTNVSPLLTQEMEQESKPNETKSDELGDAIKGFGKDALEKLSSKKAKGKQKMEVSKQQLETAAADATRGAGAITKSVQDTIKSTEQKVKDSTTLVADKAAGSIKDWSQQITRLQDEESHTTEKTVETSTPVQGLLQKTTPVTKEIFGDVELGAQTFGQGLVEMAKGFKENSLNKFVDEKLMYDTKVTADHEKTDIGANESQASSEGTSTAQSVNAGRMITDNDQRITGDGEGTLQKPSLMSTGHPGGSGICIEQTTAATKRIEGDDIKIFTKESTPETFCPEFHAQTSDVVTFETLETSSLTDKTSSAASSTDEIGRIIKEMESQLLTKFEVDDITTTEDSSEVESEDFSRECRTMPPTPMPSRKGFSHEIDDEFGSEGKDSKPVVTTPTLSRRVTGIGGSQRLLPTERPVVRVITEYVGDQHESEPDNESTYTVLEPEVRERRKFKIRFSPDMYESEEKDDTEIVEVEGTEENASKSKQDSKKAEKKIRHMEKKFERMTSLTKEADPSMTEATNSEFQRIVSQLSLEDMDQALHQWDLGGLTPSEVDSKDLTLSSEDTTSPLQQEGSHTLEPGETGETPPIPSPRTPLRPTDSQDAIQDQTDKPFDKDDDEAKNYASRKMFWEQLSSGSTETPPIAPDVAPPVPKPRARSSISQSLDIPDEGKAGSHSEASKAEASDIGNSQDLQGITTTDSVACGLTKERTFSVDGDTSSEVEFLRTHKKEDVSYDNDAFDDDTPQNSPFPEPKQRKTIFERSVSLPGDSTESASSVRAKKKIFEAQIKKEMVVEQLISQMEEEGSPERKSFDTKDQEPADQEAMLNRQIHSEIVSHELEEQIESNLLENKALVEKKVEKLSDKKDTEVTPTKTEDETSESDKTNSDIQSIYETKITSTMAEVLHYKTEVISKPSDSLEVHVDKSELEDTEKVKEIEEELKVIEEKYESHQQPSQAKVGSIASSQGESEDTFSESDVTPEDARFKEQQDIQVWGPTEKETKPGTDKVEERKRQRSVHTPEEHMPDTVWEVPIQESLETVETETVGQFPSLQRNDGILKENEAQNIAEIFVEGIESRLRIEAVSQQTETTKITVSEKTETSTKSDQMLKLVRTDTTTSSMEITDEDLRSSGMTDNSPLESQVGQIGISDHADVFGEDSGDDIDAQELDKETIGKDVVDKTLAEVKQSLEAAKEELIEEKKKKRDSITKESPSEFEFKSMVLEKSFTESIQEHHHEEAIISESKIHTETREADKSKASRSEIFESSVTSESDSHIEVREKEQKSEKSIIDSVSKQVTVQTMVISKETSKREGVDSIESQQDQTVQPNIDEKYNKVPLSTTGSEISVDSSSSKDTIIEREPLVKPLDDILATKIGVSRSSKNDSDPAGDAMESDERKSPLEDVFSTSSSSDYKGGSNEASTLDKPSVVIRKHKKSSFKDPKSDGELYSSSGSHYESFEQTSESIRSPGSRPLSSDMDGLVPNVTGMTTGSSEYESAMSGQSTTITSKEYQTAVSSLSSRDSMKSLDSESSGNLASIEVSSEASETLVPSAMELEKDSEEPVMKPTQIQPIQTEEQIKLQSFSESIEQSVSFDISEEISEDDEGNQGQAEVAARMKRSHEMTFQPEPRPIVLDEESIQTLNTSLDDMSSLVSSTTDTGAMRTVRELSKTESERMEGSATSEQLSLTVSATSDVMSLSDSKETEETTVVSKVETIATQSLSTGSSGTVQSVTITTSSINEQGIQSVCTQVTSKVDSQGTSHSNGPTQVDYNAEYDEGDHEVKKRGHRRNGSTSFRPSMIPVFHGREIKKKPEEIVEDSAESDKYSQPLTVKEGSQEEKKDVDETEKLDEESYKTEADQAMNRDLREGKVLIGECGAQSISMDSTSMSSKSRLPSTAFSEADSEIAELLKQCSSDIPSEDPIERPKTPEPVEECELKDDTPELSSEAQASVTELEMEYSGAISRSAEYAAHVSPIREKELTTQESWEHIGSEQDSFVYSPDPLHLGFDDVPSEKHELETQEVMSKDKPIDRSKSPVPDITVTHHHPASCPTPQDSFERVEMEPESGKPDASESQEINREQKVEGMKESEKETKKDDEAASESPTSDSFELLEKPDLADEFVIIEEVGKEASEQDTEGKSIRIDRKRVTPRPANSSAPPPTIESPPPTVTKMTQIKYFSSGATEEEIPFDFESGSPAKSSKSEKESSQEGSPPSADEPEFKPELEASKKWMEMQFQGEPVAQIYGYDMDYERGPLEDIKEEDINELEGSMNSKIGSMGSQVSQSIGSYGSVNSSTPDYDVLAGRKYFTRSGEHDDISMNSLQEFERLEHLLAMESGKHSKSLGSQDSLTSSSNSRKQGSRSGGDDISLASLKEFEGLESACIAAERIEKKAKEEETLLSEIEEGHESQASESESCVTISAMQRGESDEDDYERRMFEIDEIIRQAQTNVEQFMDSKSREMLDGGVKSETLGRADSLEEISKVPELDLDQPIVSYSSGKSYIQQWEDLGDDLITSTDSLELKTQKSKTSVMDPFTTSTDSLEVKISHDVMSVSTDSIEAAQKAKKKDMMTDSIEVGERSSMITSADSLEGKVTQANSIDDDELHATGIYDQSSSSGKEGDFSSSGKEDSAEGAVGLTNRMPPPRAEYLLGSTDSLEPTSSTATHATYHYETDSVMSSSFTSGDSTTMVDDNDEEGAARASIWFDEGKPYVTEVIEPIIGDDEFSHVVHRKVEMPPEIHKVSFKGLEAEAALREYIEKFDPGEDCTETREVDEHGNVHVKRVIQKRVILRPDELGGNTTDLSGPELEKYLQTMTQSKLETEPPLETIHTESHSHVTTLRTTTTTLSKGESIKTEQEQKQEPTGRGSRPPLKYDISVDEEPEFDPREHDWRFNLPTHLEREEETQDGATGYTESRAKGSKQDKTSKK